MHSKGVRRVLKKIIAGATIFLEEVRSAIFSSYRWGDRNCCSRIMFVAYAAVPTLQLSFLKPLAPLFKSSHLAAELLTDQQILVRFGGHRRQQAISAWITRRIAMLRPNTIVFCRYSGRYAIQIMKIARSMGIRTIFHIDDDLLNVPLEIGKTKSEYHNHPQRLATVRYLLQKVDLVYCSTESLKNRLMGLGDPSRFVSGEIYCSGTVINHAQLRRVTKIGYMGFDHNHDFELVVPAFVQIMRKYPYLQFELFGSIQQPDAFNEFEGRVQTIAPVRNYEKFLHALAKRNRDIGVCPLAKTPFNALKANTKWVEYTSAGAAVIASAGTIYDDCCSDRCGVLAKNTDDWTNALENLIKGSEIRYDLVRNAQARLRADYSVERLTQQVLQVLALAAELPPNCHPLQLQAEH